MSWKCSTQLVPEVQLEKATELAPKYQVILFDDDEHSYRYVIEMMSNLFGYGWERGQEIAYEIDYLGQSVVKICSLEEAMVSREQIINYGPDPYLARSTTSMNAIVQEVGL